ncbi:hypothetical protein RHGRI_001625 [Rhododendron griersonianum]|uniref:Uncharacterized protein n=1 Tax=Rhododendron griersonianum TaxID=479676 RepID=A0AAV6LPU4_9ERIC|nr:hypothetical protein RHGRI_001625 [Rhododendron griersonianum]
MGQNHLPSKSKGQLLRWVRLADPMAISAALEVLAPLFHLRFPATRWGKLGWRSQIQTPARSGFSIGLSTGVSSAGSGHGYTRAGPSVEVHNYPNRGTPTWLPDKYPGSQNFQIQKSGSSPDHLKSSSCRWVKLPETSSCRWLLLPAKGLVPVGGTCSGGKPSVLLMAGAVLFICWG